MAKGTKQCWSAIGRVGQDPEVEEKKGIWVAKLRIATTDVFKSKDDKYQERTDWHNITLFRKDAEYCKNYVHKGDSVAIEAKLRNHKWQDADGNDHFRDDLIAYNIMKVGKIDRSDSDAKEEGESVASSTEETLADIV